MTHLSNFWTALTNLLPVLLFMAGLTLLALILDAQLSKNGKW